MTVTTLRPAATSPAPATDPFTTQAQALRDRAASLRMQAEHLGPVLATSYRRRASELELEAFLVALSAA
jgi:hypothetical protein